MSLWNGLQLYSSRIVVLFKLQNEPLVVGDWLVRCVVVSMTRWIKTEQYYKNTGSTEITHNSVQVEYNKPFGNITTPMLSALVGPSVFDKMGSETSVLQAELYVTSNLNFSSLYELWITSLHWRIVQ